VIRPPIFAVGTGRSGTHLLYELFRLCSDVEAHHELRPMAESFARYVELNRLPIDAAPLVEELRGEVARAEARGRIFFEASAYLSLSVERLHAALGARFILMTREPSAVVASLLGKGLYARPRPRGDASLAAGYETMSRPHHAFSRLIPRGDDHDSWSRLTPAGQLGWYWSLVNGAVLDAFARLPPDATCVLRIEEFDHRAFGELLRFCGSAATVDRDRFEAVCAKRPGRLPGAGEEPWTAVERDEVAAQTRTVAARCGYSGAMARATRPRAAEPEPRPAQPPDPSPLLVTVGPNNSSDEDLAWMFDAGVRQFRVNFGRGQLADNRKLVERIARLRARGAAVSVFADLPGSKMRVGRLSPSRLFEAGESVEMVAAETAAPPLMPVVTPEFFEAARPGDLMTFSLSDVVMRVLARGDGRLEARVLCGGELWKWRGIWIVGPHAPYRRLWSADRRVIAELRDAPIDWIAVSFADTPEVIREARSLLPPSMRVIAKIESPSGIAAWSEIVAEADALMIGRDDLSRWLPMDAIAEWMERRRHDLIRASKPLIAASHYLDSLVRGEPLSDEDERAVRGVLAGGATICLSETGMTEHWRELVRVFGALSRG
jgi:hypothetical protein